MTRKDCNLKIASLIVGMINKYPDMRFFQILTSLNLVMREGDTTSILDEYYVESSSHVIRAEIAWKSLEASNP